MEIFYAASRLLEQLPSRAQPPMLPQLLEDQPATRMMSFIPHPVDSHFVEAVVKFLRIYRLNWTRLSRGIDNVITVTVLGGERLEQSQAGSGRRRLRGDLEGSVRLARCHLEPSISSLSSLTSFLTLIIGACMWRSDERHTERERPQRLVCSVSRITTPLVHGEGEAFYSGCREGWMESKARMLLRPYIPTICDAK